MDSTHTVVAHFGAAGDAHEAMVDLEMKGIDAAAIHLVSAKSAPVSKRDDLATDEKVSRELARRMAKGAVLGGLIGAALMVAVLTIARVEPLGTVLIIGAVAGFVGGAFIGGYWGATTRLPVNEEAFDTYVVEGLHERGVCIEVTVSDSRIANEAVNVLRRHHARQIDREVA